MYENLITQDPYGIRGACRPWNSPDALRRREPSRTMDSPEQMARCERCPRADCKGDHTCSFRLTGTWAPPKEDKPSPPPGYDAEALDRAWALEYTYKGLGKRLGISAGRAKRWLEWRRAHPC